MLELAHKGRKISLTHDGLLNRRGLTEGLARHFRSRMAASAHLLIVDIDHFKQINDTHGHQMGDAVLARVAEALKSTVRQGISPAGSAARSLLCLP